MHPILGIRPEDEAVEWYKVHNSKADRLGQLSVRNRQGSTAKKTVRVVCGMCNPGWMNDLEREVRPVLEPLLLGVPVSLLPTGRDVVARWITLKLMVGEHAQLGNAVVTQPDRSAFMRERRIPDAVKIWIGQIDSAKWKHGWQRHAATMTWPGEAPPKPFRKNIQTTVFGVGKLFVFAIVSYLADYKGGVAEAFAHVMPRLWPLSEDPWPPQRMVTEQEADRFAAHFDDVLRMPNVRWHPQPGEEAESGGYPDTRGR